ncbi:response regulator [Sphingomonas sp. CLY1604]|uniref:response regulator n=1 Tax=Sphingomonas sp. CLY1604 TaxID=3457786 RepID=UPI003FD7B28D
MTDDTSPFALVVDDDALILLNTCDILHDAGFRPLDAGDVAEAIDVLEKHDGSIRLLFTDVQMPGERDGFDLARETSTRWPEIKIMVASGKAKSGPADMPDGAVFVEKPFSADLVYDRLQELLPEGEKPEPLKSKVGG